MAVVEESFCAGAGESPSSWCDCDGPEPGQAGCSSSLWQTPKSQCAAHSACAASQMQSVAAATERKSGFNLVSHKRIGSYLTEDKYARTISVRQCTETNTPEAPQSLNVSCANVDGHGL